MRITGKDSVISATIIDAKNDEEQQHTGEVEGSLS